jgi:hypothetical protein
MICSARYRLSFYHITMMSLIVSNLLFDRIRSEPNRGRGVATSEAAALLRRVSYLELEPELIHSPPYKVD